ncbi:MAG: protein-L-isoaspartate(D-aspartate) O-methyltransferase, partial [Burkholderiales bacterium]
MVEQQIAARGIRDPKVLEAMLTVPREAFLPPDMTEFAYEDSPLPIAEGQTISQPYIVALMAEALALEGCERVLEIGTGSGYAAAIIAHIAQQVYTVERILPLAEQAKSTLQNLGYTNVHVLHADGTQGWPAHAPYDAIVVAAGGPEVPASLKSQLKIGGRLLIPIGANTRVQELVRVTRIGEQEYTTEDLADVRFVPLLGEEGWAVGEAAHPTARPSTAKADKTDGTAIRLINRHCEPFSDLDSFDLGPLLKRIGDARVVLIGEASHGTSEFYRLRQLITRQLIAEKNFSFVAIEGDWPDAARVDHYVRHFEYPPSEWTAFARFPAWMWRNGEVRAFVDWLRHHNGGIDRGQRVAFHGLDLYSLHNSIRSVLDYLDAIDPHTAKIARERYACLTPWQSDPASYGQAALTGTYRSCETEVINMLVEILDKRRAYAEHDGERFLDAAQNANLIASAERYYRVMYYGSRASWNLRDNYMFETLKTLLNYHGDKSRAVVWAHNSHIGDARATEMSSRGEFNIGQLCREEYGHKAYMIGFGTNSGTVAAASDWDGPMEVMRVRPALAKSVERLCHETGTRNFLLPLRDSAPALREQL